MNDEVYIALEDDGSQWLPFDSQPFINEEGGSRRAGILFIDHATIFDPIVMAIMSQLVIVRCEYIFPKQQFEYIAYSRHFSEVPNGVVPPIYNVELHKNDQGRIDSFRFLEVIGVNYASVL